MVRSEQSVVVVTGATRGIGLATTCLLAAQGVSLVVTARGTERLEQVEHMLQAGGARITARRCDVADEREMERTFRQAADLGRVCAVLNNAGQLEPVGPVRDVEAAAFGEHLRTNVLGVLLGMKHAFRVQQDGQPLRVVNVSSGAATHGYRGWAAYCSSKAAVNLLTEVAAAETAAASTSVVAVAPGIIETRMQRLIRETSAERFPDVAKFVAMKEAGTLLLPVEASIALMWLLLEAPLTLSGRFLDAREGEVRHRVDAWRREQGEGFEARVARARRWFDQIEVSDRDPTSERELAR
jgi:NAD(P)-dependent dehydrogenase (short-subunit alcohol dehydrogenase family)